MHEAVLQLVWVSFHQRRYRGEIPITTLIRQAKEFRYVNQYTKLRRRDVASLQLVLSRRA
jgi:hypothetical protein